MGKTLDPSQRRRKSTAKSLSNLAIRPDPSHGEFDEFDWTSTSSMSTSTNQTDPFSISMASPELEKLWDESRSLHTDANFMDMAREPSRNGSATTVSDMDFEDIDALLDSPLDAEFPQIIHAPSPQARIQQQAPSQPSYPQSIIEKQVDVMHSASNIASWTTALEKLSRASTTSTIALDELLHNSSLLLPQVTEALRMLPSDPSSMTSLLLILLCLTQTMALFEQCIPSVIRGLVACGPQDISLRLGAFQVDREAQQALQKHVINKELSRILQASKQVKQALQQPILASMPKRTHTLLIDDLHLRIKALVQVVKEKWSATQPLTL
ncbi:hypothetical protein N0V90_012115 [Kalmusia sp. IMI 367209]|nr:hypothetical protein N0V90_012115 [Kalmusia sp. IMI 367209]